MKREIKFRVWNIKQNKMFDWDILCGAKIFAVWQWINANINEEHNILMQFTGLKDKNGVDIYDSDICKVESKHGFNSDLLTEFKELNNLDTINGINGHFTGIVKIDFFRGLMFGNPLNGYCEPIFNRKIDISINHSGIEVIGNIYEHKHLLG